MNILQEDISELELKWDNGAFHSVEIKDLGRHNVIWEIITQVNANYYKVLYEGDLEGWEPFEDVKDDFVRVKPETKLVECWEEV